MIPHLVRDVTLRGLDSAPEKAPLPLHSPPPSLSLLADLTDAACADGIPLLLVKWEPLRLAASARTDHSWKLRVHAGTREGRRDGRRVAICLTNTPHGPSSVAICQSGVTLLRVMGRGRVGGRGVGGVWWARSDEGLVGEELEGLVGGD